MVKITELPFLADPDGSEIVPVVRDGEAMGVEVGSMVDGAVAGAMDERVTLAARFDAALALINADGRGGALFDAALRLAADRLPGWMPGTAHSDMAPPLHLDPVLLDMLATGAFRWRGAWRPDDLFLPGDIVRRGLERVAICLVEAAAGTTAPELDGAHWSELPLFPAQNTAFDDRFTTGLGAVSGRVAGGGFVWGVSDAGTPDAVVTAGKMTSGGLTYFFVDGPFGTVTEYGAVKAAAATPFLLTLAISPTAPFPPGLNPMLHINFQSSGARDTRMWTADGPNLVPVFGFQWQRETRPIVGRRLEAALRIRGDWLFSYIDGELAAVEQSASIGTLAGNGHGAAVFVENHPASLGGQGDAPGGEWHERVWLKRAG